MFPLSVDGTIDLPADGGSAALDRLGVAVAKVGARSIERQPDRLLFQGIRWAPSWNPLVVFDRCEVSVEAREIRYRCSTVHLLFQVTVSVAGLWILALSTILKVPVESLFMLPLFAWLVAFCGNYFVGRMKLRSLLVKALTGPPSG